MALADRLDDVRANLTNDGCRTCKWIESLPERDRAAFNAWIAAGKSLAQLHDLCASDPDNPLPVSFTGLRNHLKHHES